MHSLLHCGSYRNIVVQENGCSRKGGEFGRQMHVKNGGTQGEALRFVFAFSVLPAAASSGANVGAGPSFGGDVWRGRVRLRRAAQLPGGLLFARAAAQKTAHSCAGAMSPSSWSCTKRCGARTRHFGNVGSLL